MMGAERKSMVINENKPLPLIMKQGMRWSELLTGGDRFIKSLLSRAEWPWGLRFLPRKINLNISKKAEVMIATLFGSRVAESDFS